MDKGCIYYTDNQLDPVIMRVCQEQLRKSFPGEIISVSLKPIDFGVNIVMHDPRGIVTMYKQILMGLMTSTAPVIFFTEHDVLYHPSHFDFDPSSPDVYYYNTNVWRWVYPIDMAITYDFIRSLSGLCAKRQLLMDHYAKRIEMINNMSLQSMAGSKKEPRWARIMGYEPGTKKRRRGGPTDEVSEMWRSAYPNIDIRHPGTFSPPKVRMDSFKHPPDPATWKEISVNKIPGWGNVEGMFV